jgi:hypothetical protein
LRDQMSRREIQAAEKILERLDCFEENQLIEALVRDLSGSVLPELRRQTPSTQLQPLQVFEKPRNSLSTPNEADDFYERSSGIISRRIHSNRKLLGNKALKKASLACQRGKLRHVPSVNTTPAT